MGMFWQLFSFEPTRLQALHSGSVPEGKKHIAASATWSDADEELPDPESQRSEYLDVLWSVAPTEVRALAERISKVGISYDGLSPREAKLLDEVVSGFFCPEGLESILAYASEHDGVSPRVIDELLSRSQPSRVGGFLGIGSKVSGGHPVELAHWLTDGRRYGTRQTPDPENKYFILDNEEVGRLLAEVQRLLAVDRRWKTTEFEHVVRHELIGALERVHQSGRVLAGRYA